VDRSEVGSLEAGALEWQAEGVERTEDQAEAAEVEEVVAPILEGEAVVGGTTSPPGPRAYMSFRRIVAIVELASPPAQRRGLGFREQSQLSE